MSHGSPSKAQNPKKFTIGEEIMMKIGLLGGMSWESTIEYYRAINEGVKKALGGLNSAEIVMHSVNFGPMEQCMRRGEWDTIAAILADAVAGLERGGADFFLICTNTMHKLAPILEEKANIPLLHIADATAEVLLAHKVKTVGLLGTQFTMEEQFYKERLEEHYKLTVLIPDKVERELINRVIFAELCRGEIRDSSRLEYIRIMGSLAEQGADAIILGCTEIGLLVKQNDVSIKLFDTTPIHAESAVRKALSG